MHGSSAMVVSPVCTDRHFRDAQGAGLFRSGANGDVTNIFFENNNAALSGGGLFEVGILLTLMQKPG